MPSSDSSWRCRDEVRNELVTRWTDFAKSRAPGHRVVRGAVPRSARLWCPTAPDRSLPTSLHRRDSPRALRLRAGFALFGGGDPTGTREDRPRGPGREETVRCEQLRHSRAVHRRHSGIGRKRSAPPPLAKDPVVAAALRLIARDRARHSEFGWNFIGWVLSSACSSTIPAVQDAFSQLDQDVSPTDKVPSVADLNRFGFLSEKGIWSRSVTAHPAHHASRRQAAASALREDHPAPTRRGFVHPGMTLRTAARVCTSDSCPVPSRQEGYIGGNQECQRARGGSVPARSL